MTNIEFTQSNFERNANDLYETEEWCTSALLYSLNKYFKLCPPLVNKFNVLEPCSGRGKISNKLRKSWVSYINETLMLDKVSTNDKFRDLYPEVQTDYGLDFLEWKDSGDYNMIITNPPYGKEADKFVMKSLELMKENNGIVCMLLRANWESALTRRELFTEYPFTSRVVLNSRPKWIDDDIVRSQQKTDKDGNPMYTSSGNPIMREPKSPMHNYNWYIWDFNEQIPHDSGYSTTTNFYVSKQDIKDMEN